MKKNIILVFSIALFFSNSLVTFAAAPVQDRYYSTYTPSRYNDFMLNRMNCYGYASQLYYMGSGSYKQQPGEFAYNSEPFSALMNSYINAMTVWDNLYNFVKDRMYEDYGTLGWTISEVSDGSQAPAGKRKIALVIRQDEYNSDYHFYLQHSDGTWSHKPGSTQVTNKSIDTNETLTNSNISSKAGQGGYDDGIRYFLIGKDAITDYPHSNGQDSSTTSTPINFKDVAGDSITMVTSVSGSRSARFDYTGDKDYYKFTPSVSKSYIISTSLGTGYDVDGVIADSNGNTIASDFSTSNASFSIFLTAGSTYYIGFYDYQNHITDYTLNIQ